MTDAATRKPMILVIDDNITNLKVATEHLKAHHYEILTASNGETGFERARLARPDLILLDIQMGEDSGLEICRRLKALPETSPIPVIFMTALTDGAAKVQGLEVGGVDYLIKPFEADELLARIKIHLSLSQLQHDLAEKNEALHEVNEALRAGNEFMDDKVRARTAELAASNAALVKVHNQLQELDRLKSAFLGVITHELRSPFVNITFSLQLLERYGLDQLVPDQREQFQQLKTGIQSAKLMVDNLVAFATFLSKQGELHLTPIKFDTLVENALIPLKFQAERKQLALSANLPPEGDLPPVQGDAERLGEVIYQLTHNAIKFTAPGGKITLNVWVEAHALSCAIKDTGVGVPADKLASVWENFSQMADPLQRGVEGLGLGLSLVKYVVNAHGGEVWAESQVGVGSTFGFRLPLKSGA